MRFRETLLLSKPLDMAGHETPGLPLKDIDLKIKAERQKLWNDLVGGLGWEKKQKGKPLDRITIVTKSGPFEITYEDFMSAPERGPDALYNRVRAMNQGIAPEDYWGGERVEILLRLAGQGVGNAEIGGKVGKTEGAVKSFLHRLKRKGVEVPQRRIDQNELLEMLRRGEDRGVCAEKFHVQEGRISELERQFIADGKLPPRLDTIERRDDLIAQFSDQGFDVNQIIRALSEVDSPFGVTKKQVEGVRARLIAGGKIKRHKRGGFLRGPRS